MPGTYIALTEVNEMIDDNENTIETLKYEIREISNEYNTLKKQYIQLEKTKKGSAKEIEKKLLEMEKEKINYESLYNNITSAKHEEEKQSEIRKLALKERKEKTKTEIGNFLAEMKKIRENII